MRKGRVADVADGLIDLVLTGEFPAGRALPSEAELAVRFDVSRLTVREAIRSLAATGVIRVKQGKASTITSPEQWSPLDPRLLRARGEALGDPLLLPRRLLEARRSVEVAIAELAATRRVEAHLEQLAGHIAEMKAADRKRDVDRFARSDLAFHHVLFDAVDNVFLDALFEPLGSVMETLRRQTSAVPQIRKHAIGWHAKILEALSRSDPDGARAAMRDHLLQTERDMERFLGSIGLDGAAPPA
jgi:DNA-binding FadR family transcriptional regulator